MSSFIKDLQNIHPKECLHIFDLFLMEGSEFIAMLLIKIIVMSKDKLFSLNNELMDYMSKEMVYDAFKKHNARDLLRSKKEIQSDFQLVWVEKEK